MVNDTRQSSFDGISFATTVSTSTPATEHPDQYFEMFGHKAFWSAGWKIVSPSRLDTWDISAPAKLHEPWQLYDLRSDPGETSDVAARNPALVARLASGFDAAARRFDVLPIAGAADGVAFQARQDAADLVRRKGRWLYNGPIARIPKQVAPPFDRSAFTATAELDLPDDGATGPIFALGGRFGGAAFYLADGKPGFIVRALDGTAEVIASPEAVGRGRQSLVLKVSAPEQGARRIAIERAGRELVSGSLDIAVPPVVPETFDIGSDEATPVTDAYREHARLQGSLQSLTFQLPVPSPGAE
jgi:arylsulfatase